MCRVMVIKDVPANTLVVCCRNYVERDHVCPMTADSRATSCTYRFTIHKIRLNCSQFHNL